MTPVRRLMRCRSGLANGPLILLVAIGLITPLVAGSAWVSVRQTGAWPPETEPEKNESRADEPPELPADTLPSELDLEAVPLGLSRLRPIPVDNKLTETKVALGRRLFFDPMLSADHTVSCASCHVPEHGFASPHAVAVGIRGEKGTRNAPTVLNTIYRTNLFWDGRAKSLEEQALMPIENPVELDFTVEGVLARLRENEQYQQQFAAAFDDGITRENLAKALASFQRVLLSGNSGVDRFRAGDFAALTDDQRKGMWIFESRGGCWRCHNGTNFSDEAFHNTGVSWGKEPLDLGRFELTEIDEHRGQFKTPSLRSIALTPPYMHDGSIETLREVVEFYNKGGGKNPHLDPNIKPLELTDEQVGHLTAFLEALTGTEEESGE